MSDRGVAVAFGPVLDPAGVWGLAVVEVSSETEAGELAANDPATKARLGRIEVYPMAPGSIVRKWSPP